MARGRLGVLALGIAAVLVAVLLLSAGGDGSKPLGGVSLAEAAGKTIRAGGAEVETTVAMTPKGEAGAPTLTMRGKGFVDSTGELMLMDMDISEFAPLLPDEWGIDEDDLTVRYAYDYPVMYMHWPPIVGRIKDGKSWMKIDFSKVLDDVGVDISLFDAENYNPAQQLQFLRAAGGKVERVGTEEIRGE
jgi:hypothetical protein